ncbi:MAG: biotin carboxylase [Proteobacteria bacterium]|nr:biotin carboxylase [Pseudomonadota bacterium]
MSTPPKASRPIVAVSGLHRGENPQPGPAVVAGLRRRFPDIRIVGLSYDPMESGQYTAGIDRIDAAYLVPYPRVGHRELLERIDAIRKDDPFNVVIPCLDSELPNYIKLRPELDKRGIACMLPSEQSFAQRGKENLFGLCQRLKVPVPATIASNDPNELARFVERIGYPAYIKGRFYEAHLVHSLYELHSAFNELIGTWGGPVIAQEITVGEEYDIVGLGDGKGAIEGSCSIRKMQRTKSGKGFAGIVVEDPTLDELARKVIRALRWYGPFELEFIKAPGRPHQLFEMNPRFPAWVDFPSQIGCNLPARLLERLQGMKPTPLKSCSAGQMFVRHCVDVVGDIADLAQMASTGHRPGPAASIVERG